jgi:hypothetical protein
MGYYVDIWFEVTLKKDISELKKGLIEFKKIQAENSGWWDDLNIDDDGDIELENYNVKFNETPFEELAGFLSKYYAGSVNILGEDRCQARWLLKGDGSFEYQDGAVIYGDVLEYCYFNYALPEELKQKLLEYITARRI